MKNKFLWTAALAGLVLPLHAASLTESTFTEVVNNVKVVSGADKTTTPAKANDLFKSPDLVRTGAGSRAEMTAPDQTITRVGANTVFSFEPAGRNLNLEQGNILFHSPAGKGGGTIKSAGAVAAVLGTTLTVSATTGGGFKVILLEGKGSVTLPSGQSVTLNAGQLVFVLPGQKGFSEVLTINLAKLVGGSQLVNGFAHTLPSWPLIAAAIDEQNSQLADGDAQDTGKPPGNGLAVIDHGTYQTANHPAYTPEQFFKLLGKGQDSHPGTGGGDRPFAPVGFPQVRAVTLTK